MKVSEVLEIAHTFFSEMAIIVQLWTLVVFGDFENRGGE